MNSKTTLAVVALAALAIGSGLTACFNDSHASGGSNPVKLLAVSNGKAVDAEAQQFTTAQVMSFNHGTGTSPQPQQVSAVSAGTVLGTVMNTDPYNTPVVTICTTGGVCYRANANSGDVSQLSDVYYPTNDCSGQTAYAIVGDGPGDSISTLIFRNGGSGFVMQDASVGMVLNTDQPVNATAQSDLSNGTCNPVNLSGTFFYAINANVAATSKLPGGNVGQISFTN